MGWRSPAWCQARPHPPGVTWAQLWLQTDQHASLYTGVPHCFQIVSSPELLGCHCHVFANETPTTTKKLDARFTRRTSQSMAAKCDCAMQVVKTVKKKNLKSGKCRCLECYAIPNTVTWIGRSILWWDIISCIRLWNIQSINHRGGGGIWGGCQLSWFQSDASHSGNLRGLGPLPVTFDPSSGDTTASIFFPPPLASKSNGVEMCARQKKNTVFFSLYCPLINLTSKV